MVRARILTPQERALWREITKHDQKFHAPEEEAHEVLDAEVESASIFSSVSEEFAPPHAIIPKATQQHPVRLDNVTGTDGATARRLKRGQLPIERVLDLHGKGRVEAFALVRARIEQYAREGVRVAAIITGKGRTGEGVLRRELPHWLNDAQIRPHVVAATHAPHTLGGEGAVLVLLRRVR